MINLSRSREKTEGKLSRRRHYTCLVCRKKFPVDTMKPLPLKDRVCPDCKEKGEG